MVNWSVDGAAAMGSLSGLQTQAGGFEAIGTKFGNSRSFHSAVAPRIWSSVFTTCPIRLSKSRFTIGGSGCSDER